MKKTENLQDQDLLMNDFDMFDFTDSDKNVDKESTKIVKNPEPKTFKNKTKYVYRRAFSELNLINLNVDFERGASYHFLTGGDIDSLSYLKLVLRYIKHLDYLFFSTWCLAVDDAEYFSKILDKDDVNKIDAYVGEIFPGSYPTVFQMLRNIIKKHGGRVCVFKNHSKVFAGYNKEKDFYFVLQSSANINTNPRTENACLTIDKGLYDFYYDYFSGVVSFGKYDD